MGEKVFWSLIEFAWEAVGGKVKARQQLAEGKLTAGRAYALADSLDDVIEALTGQLDRLSAEELLAFDRTLEHKLSWARRSATPE
jgi:hypothetical protein